jgi:hypothetical protein
MDMDGWGEAKVRTPGSWANVTDMHRVISELFCHESVLNYQRRSAEAGMREAVDYLRTNFRHAVAKRGNVPRDLIQLAEGLLNELDPDHEQWSGYFPSTLVCPLHEQPDRTQANFYGAMLPVFSKCPGVPRCRAHEGVRVEG